MGEEKSEIHINNVSLERELQTEKNFFLVEAIFFFTAWILEILGDIVGSSVEKSEICININSPCHFLLHALDSLSSLEALSIFNSLIIPQSITMQILKYFQSISLQQDEGGGCTRAVSIITKFLPALDWKRHSLSLLFFKSTVLLPCFVFTNFAWASNCKSHLPIDHF